MLVLLCGYTFFFFFFLLDVKRRYLVQYDTSPLKHGYIILVLVFCLADVTSRHRANVTFNSVVLTLLL